MTLREILPLWRLERFGERWQERWRNRGTRTLAVDRPTNYEHILREIIALPADWHMAGCCGPAPLRAIALQGQARRIVHSAETGVGKSTLLLSHISQHHTAFAMGDPGGDDSLAKVRASPLLKQGVVNFVTGPTQQTLPRHTFADRLQLVLIDGPHGFPFPELEYYFFYSHLDKDALLIIDDIHIPTIFRLFSFLREEAMFDFLGVVSTTAFFRRNSAPLFNPLGDDWCSQNYNKRRFPMRRFGRDFAPPSTRPSSEFERLMTPPASHPKNGRSGQTKP